MVTVLVLLAACAGETTAPDGSTPSTPPSAPDSPVGLRVLPGIVTIETNQRIRFRGEVRTLQGQVYAPTLTWEASGGSITPTGTFSATTTGTYRIIGRGHSRGRMHRPDTSVVVVVRALPNLKGVEVSPRQASLEAGQKRTFTAMGRLGNGTRAPIGVSWAATGGTIDPAGAYVAGDVAGTYHVIATNVGGTLADTAEVTIAAPVVADPEPTSPLIRVVLRPATVFLATGSSHLFGVFGRNSLGDSVAIDVTFLATGGTITPTGLYTAGQTTGTYKVIATSNQLADTAIVTLGPTSGGGTPTPVAGTGIPMGLSALLVSGADPAPFSMSLDGYTADIIESRIRDARARKMRLLMNMTGGRHSNYMTNGVFDMAKWEAKMNTYNTAAIKAAVAGAVADGTIVGNSVMDEPANVSATNSWGPEGTMTKARVDGMCRYVKNMFPTLPVGVVHDHRLLEPEKGYQNCDFIVSQYRLSKGNVKTFRDDGLAFARRAGISIAFSLNILHGGTPGTDCEKWGDDPRGRLCPMSPEQLREFGLTLGTAGCALNMWRYEKAYIDKPEIRAALREIAQSLARLPARPCRRP
jgi:hypothetical protein